MTVPIQKCAAKGCAKFSFLPMGSAPLCVDHWCAATRHCTSNEFASAYRAGKRWVELSAVERNDIEHRTVAAFLDAISKGESYVAETDHVDPTRDDTAAYSRVVRVHSR